MAYLSAFSQAPVPGALLTGHTLYATYCAGSWGVRPRGRGDGQRQTMYVEGNKSM